MTDGDITKRESILAMPIYEMFYTLLYRMDKADEERTANMIKTFQE